MSYDGRRVSEPPLPAPIERALDQLEDAGWDTRWWDDGPRTIHVEATRRGWQLFVGYHRPGDRGGWRARDVAIRLGTRQRRAHRSSLPAVAALSDQQLRTLVDGGEVEGVRTRPRESDGR